VAMRRGPLGQVRPPERPRRPAIATTSATPVTIQQNQYVQPVKNPAHGPSRSAAKSAKDSVLQVGQQQLAHGPHHEEQHHADDGM
jgi:hypothetical protein